MKLFCNMEKLIEIIKNFNFNDNLHFRQLEIELSKSTEFPVALQMQIPKGKKIFRCRKNENKSKLFYFESDISYRRDIENIKYLGRCNKPYSSKFYGSIATESIKHGYITSITETSSLFRNKANGIERFTTGMWNIEKPINALVIIPDLDNPQKSKLNIELVKAHNNIKNKEEFNDKHIELVKLLNKEFSKTVKVNSEIEYFISAIFSEKLLQESEFIDAVVFASIQADSEGLNIVMNPQKADEILKLEAVAIHDFIKIKDNILLNTRSIANLSEGYPFAWKPVSDEEFMPYDYIKAFFLQKCDITHEALMDIFLEPLLE